MTRSHTSSNANSTQKRRVNNDAESHANSCSNTNSLSNSNSQSDSNAKSSLPSVVCIEGNKSVFAAMVGRVVKHTIFPKKQFIILERELDENGKLAEHCVQALKLERSKWYSVRNLVRQRLNRVRNNAQQCVRQKLFSKLFEYMLLLCID